MRGNLQTRIAKMRDGACDALMLAHAGVSRMGYEDMVVHTFPEQLFVPPVGQGCIAVEASSRLGKEKKELVRRAFNDRETEYCLTTERAFLREIEGGCSVPVFGLARVVREDILFHGGIVSLDGSILLRCCERGSREEAAAIGERAGRTILENGGRNLLGQIKKEQAQERSL
ncbi:unnamed protein product, partial [Cyprideis torosa]